MVNRPIFLIVTWNKYPEEDAGAVRQHAFAENLKELGYRPIIVGMGKSTGFQFKDYNGIEYISLRYATSNILIRAIGRVFFPLNLARVLKKLSKETVAGILLVSGDYLTFQFVKSYSAKNKVQLYHDSVEWYSPCEYSRGERDRAYRLNNTINTKLIDQSFRVFAISRYLQQYFSNKGLFTVRIPVIMDVSHIDYHKEKRDQTIHFLFAGNIAGKDRVKEFIDGIELLDDNLRNRIEFTILGCTYEQYKETHGLISDDTIERNVFFRGRVSREEVMNYLCRTDFTILFRPAEERYAMAGFPTKVVESLASGTPVVCNLSSDLELYLKDGYNSVLVEEPTPECCKNALIKICSYDDQMISSMKKHARLTAEKYFDRRKYLDIFKELIKE